MERKYGTRKSITQATDSPQDEKLLVNQKPKTPTPHFEWLEVCD